MKPIRLSAHAHSYTLKHGFTEAEVQDAIRSSPWEPAELGREWNGKVYQTKQVRPIFVEETDEILVVTVYTYYF